MMLLTFFLSSSLLLVNADTSVHILSTKYGQLVTSSILNWIPDQHYSASKLFVMGGYENVESSEGTTDESTKPTKRPIFVCRALHNGVWVAGGQKEGEKHCTVTLTGSVASYERYQLLENVESAARVRWNSWTKLYSPPVGTVAAAEKLYVARYIAGDNNTKYFIGTLNSQDSLGTLTYVKEDGEEGTADKGEVLVEIEPIGYELSDVRLNHAKARTAKQTPRVLGEATISNTGESPAKMAEAFGYSYLYTLYWGQGHAMLKGLNTSVILQNKTRLPDMKWGIDIRENRTSVYTVEVYLEPGTAVNVTLRGMYSDIEVPYTGNLLSYYEDNASTNPRKIAGTRREESITDIKPEFGPIYYLSNFSLVPTTIAPPTTEPMTTVPSTTFATTRQQQQQQTDRLDLADGVTDDQYTKEIDENSIHANRPDITGMQGDDGGPQSLKNKAEGSQSGSASLGISLLTLVATTLAMPIVINRVT